MRAKNSKHIPKDTKAIVLDFLPKGKTGVENEPLAQVLGVDYFSLLEVKPKREFKILEEISVAKDSDDISFIRRISYEELTGAAQAELENAIKKIVESNEHKFVEFFNKSSPITIRMHQLELLPGFGKKHLAQILDAREEKPFESFEDIEKRIQGVPDPKRAIVKRILEEIKNPDEKYRLFVPFSMQRKR